MRLMLVVAAWMIVGSGPGLAFGQDEPSSPGDHQDMRLAGGDENKQFYLFGPSDPDRGEPESGYRLLVVIPGGDGSAAFRGFVENIARNSTSDDYLVVQLIAPQWSENQFSSLVWPTRTNQWPEMKFASEDFLFSVIDELEKSYTIDRHNIYTLSWSSGGPLAYAASLAREKRVTGSLVAMSVFKPDQLPKLEAAKGHAYYLLHSPTDFIAMSHPVTARTLLSTKGASVKLETYTGGHGWHGDVFGNIRRGIRWLEKEAQAIRERQKSDESSHQ